MSASACRALLMVLAAMVITASVSAATHASVYSDGPIVLVLKLVSATRVQPTTGVVVSADGLVIVSADFINDGDEIVVMDGGTDISTYARPATLVKRDDTSGLALMSVSSLSRTPILQSESVAHSDGDLHLAAFPPAAQIADGDAPLWLPVDVLPASGRNQWRVVNADDLPNVSGPILDTCGFFAGVSLASGAQSLTSGGSTSIIGAPLQKALANLDVTLASASCDTSAVSERDADAPVAESAPVRSTPEPPSVEETMPRLIDDGKYVPKPVVIEDEFALPIGDDSLGTDTAIESSVESSGSRPAPSIRALVPWWLWLLIAVLLAALIFKLGTLWRLVSTNPAPPAANLPRRVPVVEPPTIELLRGSADRAAHGLAKYAAAEDQMPDISQLPEGFNAIICVTGQLSDLSRFSRYCIADKAHIDIIIGRGDTDISIESPTVSRQHARLKGTMNALTLSDLNSNNGTFIGAVPCLPSEIMYIGPSDEITLGDVRFTIAVKYKIERLS